MFWFLYGTSSSSRLPGPEVVMRCPACGKADAGGRCYVAEEKIRLYFIPLPTQRETHVVCLACGADRVTGLSLKRLTEADPAEIGAGLRVRPSFVAQSLAVFALVTFWAPIFGLTLSLVAVAANRKSRGWAYKLAVAAAVLTTLFWGLLLARSALVELKVI